ncbi:MAG TPA: HEAT repeat domain-containing protein [Vicinamibacterales bacterium]|nr:HEAT repeat domain-containing protein [Vicinamibacterales bacterium]
MSKRIWAIAIVVGLAGCLAKKPPAPPAPPPPPPVSLDTKAAWMLRLEHQRALRDAGVDAPAAPGIGPRALTPATAADLEGLALDPDAALRRRALLAIGRVGLAESAPALITALTDPDENVRATAAFALGLLASKDAIDPLKAALKEPSVQVRGRAAEALGLIGDRATAPAVADAAAGCRTTIAAIEPDDEEWPKSPEVELCRLALFALVRLRDFDALARVAQDEQGQPVSRWWPVAYALQRIADARAAPALLALSSSSGVYTPAFALRGLAAAKDRRLVAPAAAIATRGDADVRLRVAAVRALGQGGGADVVDMLVKLIGERTTPPNLALEAVNALTAIGDPKAFQMMLNLLTDPWPAIRAAAIAGAARLDPEGFLLVISTFDRDKDWSVRAALAGVLATLPADRAAPGLQELAADDDSRVRGPALEGLARIEAADLTKRLFDALEAPDFVLRTIAARLMGERRPEGGAARLGAAYVRGEGDASYGARAAALEALAKYGGEDAVTTLRKALADRDWPVRLRAAELLRGLGQADASPARPAPVRQPLEFFESPRLLRPDYSPHAFIETRLGTIEIELNVVDAPLTSLTFMELARAGFFNGLKVHRVVPNFVIQAGDPRGDGEGGPGYTIRDELSPLPYLRGTVGMAIDGQDTAGSQFFIALSPQPHLDGKYTAFGRVVNGMDLLDRVELWDVIERVRIWDGKTMGGM